MNPFQKNPKHASVLAERYSGFVARVSLSGVTLPRHSLAPDKPRALRRRGCRLSWGGRAAEPALQGLSSGAASLTRRGVQGAAPAPRGRGHTDRAGGLSALPPPAPPGLADVC